MCIGFDFETYVKFCREILIDSHSPSIWLSSPVLQGATPERGNGGDDDGWVTQILLDQKMKKNSRGRFNCYKWMVNI
jgi:hypothetical protein